MKKTFFLGLKFEWNLSVNIWRSGTDYCWLYWDLAHYSKKVDCGFSKIESKKLQEHQLLFYQAMSLNMFLHFWYITWILCPKMEIYQDCTFFAIWYLILPLLSIPAFTFFQTDSMPQLLKKRLDFPLEENNQATAS